MRHLFVRTRCKDVFRTVGRNFQKSGVCASPASLGGWVRTSPCVRVIDDRKQADRALASGRPELSGDVVINVVPPVSRPPPSPGSGHEKHVPDESDNPFHLFAFDPALSCLISPSLSPSVPGRQMKSPPVLTDREIS